ncbi:MAG: FecR family protein, partial [Chitinophagaceae bacterium]
MTKKPSAAAILEKFAKNKCTPQEVAWLEAAFNEELKVNEQVFAKEEIEAAHLRMRSALDEYLSASKKTKKLMNWTRMVAAASIVILLGIGLLYFTQKPNRIENLIVLTHKVKPGGNKAYLTLPNGRQIALDSKNEQVIMKDSIFYENGELIGVSEPAKSLVLQTPRGGQYRLTLADGTKVWLNAASSITYPTRFNAERREVSISGEVYFEVAHDKTKPFIVRANQQEVEVLGTHFNISAYPEQENIYTTLAEGK